MAEGYCNKCKSRREVTDVLEEITRDGRRVIKGCCNTCGSDVIKIASSEEDSDLSQVPKVRVN